MIVVLATDHPQRDDWVDRTALDEADRSGMKLPPYQGVIRIPPERTPVHVFTDPVTFDDIRRRWAEIQDALDETAATPAGHTEGDTT